MDDTAFFNAVRSSLFGGRLTQDQVDGIKVILKVWNQLGDGDDRKLAYILGTAFHETAHTMQPVRETLAKTDAKAKEILTKAWRAGKLPWVSKDYWSSGFFGRGFVQLTWRHNYEKAGKKLGIDLVNDPSLALQSSIAAHILIRGMLEGWFTGKKLSDYIKPGSTDYKNARRVVNGTDRADMIAGYAEKFELAIQRNGGFAPAKPVEPSNPAPRPDMPPAPEKPSSGPPDPGGNARFVIIGLIALAAIAAVIFLL